MNTQTPQEKDFTVFIPEQKINPFLVKKLKQICIYISEPSEDGEFFAQMSGTRITGQQAQSFICLANVFGYDIEFATVNKAVVFFYRK